MLLSILQSSILMGNVFALTTSGSGPLRTPVSSASIAAMSSAVSAKSKMSRFSAIAFGPKGTSGWPRSHDRGASEVPPELGPAVLCREPYDRRVGERVASLAQVGRATAATEWRPRLRDDAEPLVELT
jgi:hypothetical protein